MFVCMLPLGFPRSSFPLPPRTLNVTIYTTNGNYVFILPHGNRETRTDGEPATYTKQLMFTEPWVNVRRPFILLLGGATLVHSCIQILGLILVYLGTSHINDDLLLGRLDAAPLFRRLLFLFLYELFRGHIPFGKRKQNRQIGQLKSSKERQ